MRIWLAEASVHSQPDSGEIFSATVTVGPVGEGFVEVQRIRPRGTRAAPTALEWGESAAAAGDAVR